MTWEPMTIDEYADFQKANGAKVVNIGGTWWTEARPFFYRPLFPFAQVAPGAGQYPVQSRAGGVIHLVPPGADSNTCMNLYVYDGLKDYSLEQLGAKQRWIIKQGLKNFEAKRITGVANFVEEAFPIYDSFYHRTRYFYKKERTDRDSFATWAAALFRFPKVVVMGAYHEGVLCAVDVSYRVEDVIIDDVFFSDTDSQSLRVTDFLLHTLREGAKGTDAALLFRGLPTGKGTLDESKVKRGCKVMRLPAYFKVNPIALLIGKLFMNDSYRKLLAITSPEATADLGLPPKPGDPRKFGFLTSQNLK